MVIGGPTLVCMWRALVPLPMLSAAVPRTDPSINVLVEPLAALDREVTQIGIRREQSDAGILRVAGEVDVHAAGENVFCCSEVRQRSLFLPGQRPCGRSRRSIPTRRRTSSWCRRQPGRCSPRCCVLAVIDPLFARPTVPPIVTDEVPRPRLTLKIVTRHERTCDAAASTGQTVSLPLPACTFTLPAKPVAAERDGDGVLGVIAQDGDVAGDGVRAIVGRTVRNGESIAGRRFDDRDLRGTRHDVRVAHEEVRPVEADGRGDPPGLQRLQPQGSASLRCHAE